MSPGETIIFSYMVKNITLWDCDIYDVYSDCNNDTLCSNVVTQRLQCWNNHDTGYIMLNVLGAEQLYKSFIWKKMYA